MVSLLTFQPQRTSLKLAPVSADVWADSAPPKKKKNRRLESNPICNIHEPLFIYDGTTQAVSQ